MKLLFFGYDAIVSKFYFPALLALKYYLYYYNIEYLISPFQWGRDYNIDFKNDENWIKLKSFCGYLMENYI